MIEAPFQFPGQTGFYRGKVRDVYTIEDRFLVMIASDRISAFDVVLPRPIPYKGQVLNQIAARMLEATKDIVPNWVLEVPLPHVSIGKRCVPFPVEMVVRGNLTGHAWRTYKSGKRELCGVSLPQGLKENDYFPQPIITPTTKAHEGHDMDISRKDILVKGLVSEQHYNRMEAYTLALFARGRELAARQGLILVDTKYEFGIFQDEIYLIDEVHTPDSSRYFYAEGYEDNQKNGIPQKQLSKEFVREWLMDHGFQGQHGQSVPPMDDAFVKRVSDRYIELYENITGEPFVRREISESSTRDGILEALGRLEHS